MLKIERITIEEGPTTRAHTIARELYREIVGYLQNRNREVFPVSIEIFNVDGMINVKCDAGNMGEAIIIDKAGFFKFRMNKA